jgi:hypothetical protein
VQLPLIEGQHTHHLACFGMQRTRISEETSEIEPPSTYTRGSPDLTDSDAIARAHAMKPPAKNAPADERKMWLDHQLDTLAGKTLLRQFIVLPPHQRRYGGARQLSSGVGQAPNA